MNLRFNTFTHEWEFIDGRTGRIVEGPFGLWDTEKGGWIGDDRGPVMFDQPGIAQVAAQVSAVRLGWEQTRIRPRPFRAQSVHKTEDLELKMEGDEALKKIEDGEV